MADDLAGRFAERAEAHDRDGTFPHENVADLRLCEYPALSVPAAFGGVGATLLESALCQERLARGDASTALGMSMHLSIMGRLGCSVLEAEAGHSLDLGGWNRQRYETVARAVVERGALINSAASEPDIGSPSRGGRPRTLATELAEGSFTLTGRKTFTTMSPALSYVMVSATITGSDGSEATGNFLFDCDLPGVRIEETWDAMGMRASGSHDLVLEGVVLPGEALLTRRASASGGAGEGTPDAAKSDGRWISEGAGWGLLVPAVYLGIAGAAAESATRFAQERRPQPMAGKSIAELPAIQRLLGEMQIGLTEARVVLFGVAEAWLECPEQRERLTPLLTAAKYVATNRAVEITDRAMRVVSGAGLARSHPVQRHFRDVRAGLHHPPMDDATLATMARMALREVG